MNIKVGGSMSYRIQVGQYEPTEVLSSVEIEKFVEDEECLDKEIEMLQNKIDTITKKDINKKVEIACQNYKVVKELLRKSLQ